MKKENLGDWCKWLERNFSNEIAIPYLPLIIRLDGNNFHKWTKGLDKPFDLKLVELMIETTKYLVGETNAIVGYTQSDEITLILYSDNKDSALYNGGKKQKILSKLSAKASVFFNKKRLELLPNHNKDAVFDCRVYQVPTLRDACLQLLWRERDAIKNSISSLAQSLYSHSELNKLNGEELKYKMLMEKNVSWEKLNDSLKRGTYIKRITSELPFSPEEIEKLPDKHRAKFDKNFKVIRSQITKIDMPELRLITNREDVFFNDCVPIISNLT